MFLVLFLQWLLCYCDAIDATYYTFVISNQMTGRAVSGRSRDVAVAKLHHLYIGNTEDVTALKKQVSQLRQDLSKATQRLEGLAVDTERRQRDHRPLPRKVLQGPEDLQGQKGPLTWVLTLSTLRSGVRSLSA